METIFEHNISEKELYGITGFEDITKESYLKIKQNISNDNADMQIKCYVDLYYLYYQRGDKYKANEFAKKIPESDWKWFTMLNHDFDPMVE